MTTRPSQEQLDTEEGPSWVRRVPWVRLLAEFAVIFLGITLSLLADDWRQSRNDLVAERRALQELLVDLAGDSVLLGELLSQTETHDRAAMWLYQRVGDPRVEADSVIEQLGATQGFDVYNLLRASYTGLLSTGQLGVIQDEALRGKIITYYEDLQPEVLTFHDIYYDVWYPFRELAGPDYEWVYASDAEVFQSSVGARLRRAWSEVSSDPSFVFRLREVGVVANVVSELASEALAKNADLRAAIHSRIDR